MLLLWSDKKRYEKLHLRISKGSYLPFIIRAPERLLEQSPPFCRKGPQTHEWVQLMGHGWHVPFSSGNFQMGMKERSGFTPLGQRATQKGESL